MSKLLAFVFLGLLCLSQCKPNARGRYKVLPKVESYGKVSQNLYIDNAYECSDKSCVWGSIQLCPEDGFATAFEVKYQKPGKLDETAMNGIRLYCSKDGIQTGYIESSVGPYGEYYGMRICPDDLLTGFRANVLDHQGVFSDNVAVEDFEVDCSYGKYIVSSGISESTLEKLGAKQPLGNFKEGEWSSFSTCSQGSAVCGLQTKLDLGAFEDQVALADVVLFCCPREDSSLL